MPAAPRLAVRRLFEDDAAFFAASAWILGVLSILRGIRFPNLWSATQAQLDYSNGIIKRGLFGQVFTHALGLQHYLRFALFSFACLGLTAALLVLLVRDSGVMHRVARGLPVLVFGSSLATLYLAHLVGYVDVLQLAVVIALLLVRSPRVRAILALPAVIAAVLVHESFLLLFLPVLLFSFFVDLGAGRMRRVEAVLAGVALTGGALLIDFFVSGPRVTDSAGAQALQQQIQTRVDFPVRPDVLLILSRSLKDNLIGMLHAYGRGEFFGYIVACLISLGPVLALMLFYVDRLGQASGRLPLARFGAVFCATVCGAALSMLLLGWDIGRWFCLASFDVFLCLLLVARALPAVTVPVSPVIARCALLIVALNMASGETLLDSRVPRPYPFIHSVRDTLRTLARDGSRFIPKDSSY